MIEAWRNVDLFYFPSDYNFSLPYRLESSKPKKPLTSYLTGVNGAQICCVCSSRRGAEYPQGTVSSRMTAVSSRVHTCPAVWQVKPVQPPKQTDVWLVNRSESWKGGLSVATWSLVSS